LTKCSNFKKILIMTSTLLLIGINLITANNIENKNVISVKLFVSNNVPEETSLANPTKAFIEL
jgi:hypothetical protein